ncbi:MAG: hypothetical protein KIT74_06555 [Fimbriimonadales bacterium]|nr:hypothetical protein [Fimbriimonadales bacterium]
MKWLGVVAVVAANLVLAGCGQLESKIVGSWSGRLLSVEPGSTGYPMTISFRSDRTYYMTLAGDHFQGDWQVEHNWISMKHRTVNNVPLEDYLSELAKEGVDPEFISALRAGHTAVLEEDGRLRLTSMGEHGFNAPLTRDR